MRFICGGIHVQHVRAVTIWVRQIKFLAAASPTFCGKKRLFPSSLFNINYSVEQRFIAQMCQVCRFFSYLGQSDAVQ
jgi:hypothetical protein